MLPLLIVTTARCLHITLLKEHAQKLMLLPCWMGASSSNAVGSTTSKSFSRTTKSSQSKLSEMAPVARQLAKANPGRIIPKYFETCSTTLPVMCCVQYDATWEHRWARRSCFADTHFDTNLFTEWESHAIKLATCLAFGAAGPSGHKPVQSSGCPKMFATVATV